MRGKQLTYGFGLLVFIHSLMRGIREVGVRSQFRNNVMAVMLDIELAAVMK